MNKRGRPAKPLNLAKLEGKYRPECMKDVEGNTPESDCLAPAWLDSYAIKMWNHTVETLKEMGLFKRADENALAAYCLSYSKWRTAEEVLMKKGLTLKTKSGYETARPEVNIANQAKKDMMAIATQFGLTPSSRARLVLIDPDSDSGESLGDLLR